MHALKKYIADNFESAFVLLILVSTVAIVYYLPYKLSFLNFFFIPVLLSSYYLSVRSALLGTMLVFLVVSLYAYLYPDLFMPKTDTFSIWASILTWACFLVLTAIVVSFTHRNLQEKIDEAVKVRTELSSNRQLLEQTIETLDDVQENFDYKVQERTQALEESTRSIEMHKEKVEETLYATMDPAVVKLMIDKSIRTENREISVQFCDLKGFTEYSESHSPDVVITELNKYLAEMERILLQYRAHIDKYIGDGIMTEFGAPTNYDKHALLAVAAGWKMQQSMERNNYPWPLRVGVATGPATTGLIGAKRQSYTALGDTVNLASRIESLCAPGKVTVDEVTYHASQQYFHFARKPLKATKGPVDQVLVDQIDSMLQKIEAEPENVDLRLEAGDLFTQVDQVDDALDHYKVAVNLDTGNERAKLAYADALLAVENDQNVFIKGRNNAVHLFEVVGLKDPILAHNNLPHNLYLEQKDHIEQIVTFPEDTILPIECLDGSVGFARMVGFLSYIVARRLNLPDQECHDVLEAGYLAETGKSIIPEYVLNHRGGLSPDDIALVHMHPREGARKLMSMGYRNQPMLDMVENHHENYDGSGYPAGLSGEEIPIGARILAVAESYISLTSARPYRDAWEVNAAYHEMKNFTERGKFDPQVIEVLGDIISEISSDSSE